MNTKRWFLTLIVLALLVWAVFDITNYLKADWQCSTVTCGKVVTAEEWINQNCYTSPTDSNQIVCTVNINNTKQLVPLNMIDTTTLTQCIEPVCVQEVMVRNVNYTITNVTG
ncbi:MAG: hypothetical protein QW404_00220 [Candidatus Nanoarchaeia archaeon]